MKIRLAILALVIAPLQAQAAWFCDSDTDQFVLTRLTHEQSKADRKFLDISSGNVIRGQIDKSDIDRFSEWLLKMEAWTETLDDSCLRDAYRKWIEVKRREDVEKPLKALEFMKTPRDQERRGAD